MFEWKSSYSVGVASVDTQHQNLFAIARELQTAMTAGKGKVVMGQTLDRLVQYTLAHFAFEEQLMRQYKYPGLPVHQVEHLALTKQVADFQKEFKAGRANMTVDIFRFLNDWLNHHIQESDKKFGPFVQRAA